MVDQMLQIRAAKVLKGIGSVVDQRPHEQRAWPLVRIYQRLGDRPRQFLRGIVAEMACWRGDANASQPGGPRIALDMSSMLNRAISQLEQNWNNYARRFALAWRQGGVHVEWYVLSRWLTKREARLRTEGFSLHLPGQLRYR